MTSHLRQFLLALCSVLLIPSGSAAVTYNDLWWIPSESGWGTNIAQQGDTLFMTFFVYGTDSKPTWFVAQLARTGTSAAGQPVFTGKTYVTTGPWYGGLFTATAGHRARGRHHQLCAERRDFGDAGVHGRRRHRAQVGPAPEAG